MKRLLILFVTLLVAAAAAAEVAWADSPSPADAAAAALLARQAMHTTAFTIGKSGPLIVAFEDPNCRFCNQLSEEVDPLAAAGKVRIRVVLVAFLKPDSEARAAGILQSADPAAAWARNQADFDHGAEEGGYPGAQASFDTDRALRFNLDILRASGEVATPSVLVCEKGAKTPILMRGVPKGSLAPALVGAGSVTASGGCAPD